MILLLAAGCSDNSVGPNVQLPENKNKPVQAKNEVAAEKPAVLHQPRYDVPRGNPFLTVAEARALGVSHREVLTGAKLSAIFYSPKGSYAILNGAVIKRGDMFGGKKVLGIGKNSVLLRDGIGEYIVTLVNG